MADTPMQTVMETVLESLEETFEQVRGIYLDRGTSLFETLATISAEMASQPVSPTCASLAAQVEHVRFYIDLNLEYAEGKNPPPADWGEIWRTVRAVTPEEWEANISRLRASYERLMQMARSEEAWQTATAIEGAIVCLVHTAYHLGEIRQALCTLRQQA